MTIKRTHTHEHYVPTVTLKKIPSGDYLRKGDRFVASHKGPSISDTIISGVAAMDGHMVSENFGFRGNNDYFKNQLDTGQWETKDGYINVHLDGVEYGYNHNESLKLYEWVFYVSPEVYDRVQRDIQDNKVWGERKELELKLAQQRARADALAKELGAAERGIQTIRSKIDRLNRGVK